MGIYPNGYDNGNSQFMTIFISPKLIITYGQYETANGASGLITAINNLIENDYQTILSYEFGYNCDTVFGEQLDQCAQYVWGIKRPSSSLTATESNSDWDRTLIWDTGRWDGIQTPLTSDASYQAVIKLSVQRGYEAFSVLDIVDKLNQYGDSNNSVIVITGTEMLPIVTIRFLEKNPAAALIFEAIEKPIGIDYSLEGVP